MKFSQFPRAGLLLASLGVVLCATQALGQSTAFGQTVKNSALQATMRLDGSYELDFFSTGWKLEGHLPGNPDDVRMTDGTDKIGHYHQVAASSRDGSGQMKFAFTILFLSRFSVTGAARPAKTFIHSQSFNICRKACSAWVFSARILASMNLAN